MLGIIHSQFFFHGLLCIGGPDNIWELGAPDVYYIHTDRINLSWTSLQSTLILINNRIYVRISVPVSLKHKEQERGKNCCLNGKKEARSSTSLCIFLFVWGEGKREEKGTAYPPRMPRLFLLPSLYSLQSKEAKHPAFSFTPPVFPPFISCKVSHPPFLFCI